MARTTSWPSADIGLDIHARLVEGDPVAPSELAERYLDSLADSVVKMNPRVDDHLCEQAAEDAILALIKNPRSFNPDKSDLDAYLRMSARGDLRNLLEREQRHLSRREHLDRVEVYGAGRNGEQEGEDPANIVGQEESEQRALASVADSIVRLLSKEESDVFALMIQGERSTAAYARLLGITELSELEQRREVKKAKDRIKRRLQRARGKS